MSKPQKFRAGFDKYDMIALAIVWVCGGGLLIMIIPLLAKAIEHLMRR